MGSSRLGGEFAVLPLLVGAAFGDGTLYDSMLGHIANMSRDISLVERHGPNAAQTARVMNDVAQRADVAGSWANRAAGSKPET